MNIYHPELNLTWNLTCDHEKLWTIDFGQTQIIGYFCINLKPKIYI